MSRIEGFKNVAGEAVTKASDGLETAESIAAKAGMTKNNDISQIKLPERCC